MTVVNSRKFILSVAVSFVVTVGLAYLFHKVVMGTFYEEKYQHDIIMGHPYFILLAYAVLSGLMSFIYPYFYRGGTPLVEGIKFGVFFGLLWRGLYLLVEYGYGIVDSDLVITDGAWHVLEQGITGVLIGLIYGKDMMMKGN